MNTHLVVRSTGSPAAELQIRIPCQGRRAHEVLDDLQRGLDDAQAQGRDPLVVLENLALLEDSLVALIKGISRRTAAYPRTVALWEASGYTEAFLSVVNED